MKKSSNGSIDILRYFCILAAIAIGMIAIIGSSSGGGGDGSDGTDGSGGEGSSGAVWNIVGDQVSPATAESEDPTMMVVDGSPVVGYREASFKANMNLWDGNVWGTSITDPTNGNMNYTGYHAPS